MGITTELRKTGLGVLDDMPWGTHCCHFFQTQKDLVDTLIPFFKVGLAAKEFCLWVIHAPLTERRATMALKQGIPDGDRYLADGSIEIVSTQEWYLKGGKFSLKRVLNAWDEKLAKASTRGYVGMRANANVAWLGKKDWRRFEEYERELNESLALKPMIVLCSYSLETCSAMEVLDVARTHQYAIGKRSGRWEVVEWRVPPGPSDPHARLTTREREVLLLAAEGVTNPHIAKHLSISVRTVESHRANLMRKLGLRNQTDLVRYAVRRGLPPIDTNQS
jgi:DNA-binding CsgD family transcriptional regulator